MTYSGSSTSAFANFLLGLPPYRVTYIAKYPRYGRDQLGAGVFLSGRLEGQIQPDRKPWIHYELVSPWVDELISSEFRSAFNNNTDGLLSRLADLFPIRTREFPRLYPLSPQHSRGSHRSRSASGPTKTNSHSASGLPGASDPNRVIHGSYGIVIPVIGRTGSWGSHFHERIRPGVDKGERPTVESGIQPWPTPQIGGDVVLNSSAFSVNAMPVKSGCTTPLVQQYNGTFLSVNLGLKTSVRFSYIRIHSWGAPRRRWGTPMK